MGGRRNIILNLLPSLFSFIFLIIFHRCTAIDAITTTQYITDPQTLVSSSDKIFRLGFFSPGNSTNRYVGIWYNNIPGPTIVWVANRDNPLNDSSGVLRIANDGNLVVLDGRGNLLWTTDVSDITSSNSIAELLDSGNLVFRETNSNNKGRILWQSFDCPSDTFLPTMKLGANLRTGEKLVLTSWKDTHSDPSTGSFTLELNPFSSIPQVNIIRNGSDNQRHWRSGQWAEPGTGQIFLGLSNNPRKFSLLADSVKGTVYLTNVDKSVLSRLVLESDGNLVERQWDDHKKEWLRSWWSRNTECDVYGRCGPFGSCNACHSPICSCLRGFEPKFKDEWRSGNWSGGCVRRAKLQCERKNKSSIDRRKEADGFLTLEVLMEAPDYVNWLKDAGFRECGYMCLRNCSCIAYSHTSYTGCMWWTGDLIDIQSLRWFGTNHHISFETYLHIRVAYSELDKRDAKIIIIITVLIAGIVTISVCTYFCWRMAKQRDYYGRRMAKQRDSCWRWMEKQRGTMHDYYFYLIGRMRKGMRKNVQRERKRRENKKKVKGMRISIFGMDDAYGEPSDSNMLIGDNPELKKFNFETVAIATNNFSEANKLGHGGFGTVYKGKLLDGQELAVKRLSKNSGQGIQEFRNEVLVISKLQHRNLVRLLGCCIEGEEKILIYEYMPNKSLDAFLFDPNKRAVLDWRKRFQIIEGISRGILYLHRDSRLRVIHRDLKASNILLDEKLNPKISDFGMARIFGGDEVHANTRRVVGTYGYMSPEYVIEGRFSEKSDVFSFGVLLLEIVSGKRNTSFYHEELSLRLLGYAWKLWNENKAESLIDPILLSEPFFKLEITRCIHVGLLCVQEFAMDRPTMSTTLSMLTSELATLPTPKNPAFTERRISSDSSSSRNNRIHSINNVTITSVGGR